MREDGSWDPEAGVIYVWYDALINYITGAGFPDDTASFERWWPADLHVIGKDIARFHTIFWPAMLWSAGLEAPRHVWVHGWLMAAGGERMSKSRGNFLDPNDFVAAFGSDGARYVVLREVPFDRDAEVSWDSFVRRYNADLANDFGNLVNRTVSMTERYLDGERPAPRLERDVALGRGLERHDPAVCRRARGLPTARRARPSCGSSSAAPTGSSTPRSPGSWRRPGRPATRPPAIDCAACSAISSRRAGWSGSRSRRSCRPRRRASSPSSASGTAYGPDGNGGSSILGELEWGARASEAGRVAAPEPLFPRLETEAAAEAAAEA